MRLYPPMLAVAAHRCVRVLVLVAVAIQLTACATAVVLKQDAGKVSEATKATVAEARKFYAQLGERRLDYLILVLASGSHCRYGFPVVLLEDDSQLYGWRCLTQAESADRLTCLDTPDAAGCGSVDMKRLIAAPEFAQTSVQQSSALVLIDAIADYQILLAKIVADPKIDTKAELTVLQDRVNSLKGIFDALNGSESGKLDLSKEIGALATLLDLLRQANNDRRDLVALRALMIEHGGKFERDLVSLATRYRSLDAPMLMLFDEQQLSREMMRLNERLPKLDEAARVKAMRAQATAELALSTRKSAPNPLAQAFDALLKAHVTLREAVVDGKLTDDQRRRAADVALTQLKAWFDAIRGVISLF